MVKVNRFVERMGGWIVRSGWAHLPFHWFYHDAAHYRWFMCVLELITDVLSFA